MQCPTCTRRFAKSKGACPYCGKAPRTMLERTLAGAATRGQGKARTPSLPKLKFLETTDED